MIGYPFAEFRMQQAMSPSCVWQELDKSDLPKTIATTHRLKMKLEKIRMTEGEDPLLFLGRVDKAAHKLAMIGWGNSVEEVNRHIVNNVSSLYNRYLQSWNKISLHRCFYEIKKLTFITNSIRA